MPELTLVVPAFNEAPRIEEMLRCWGARLDQLGLDYEIHVFDDGSWDDTPSVLATLARRLPHLTVTTQENRGHGPTVLRGYLEARSEWVAQVDADDEVGPDPFAELWTRRDRYDLLLGVRRERSLALSRRALTRSVRLMIRWLFGSRLIDANSPYRLMRTVAIAPLWRALPSVSFAPNLMIAAAAAARGLRILEMPVSAGTRPSSRTSLSGLRLARGAALAATQLVAWRLRRVWR